MHSFPGLPLAAPGGPEGMQAPMPLAAPGGPDAAMQAAMQAAAAAMFPMPPFPMPLLPMPPMPPIRHAALNGAAPAAPAWPAPEEEEPSLDERPLEFLCQHSATGSSPWQPVIWDEARRCFSFHLPGAIGSGMTKQFFDRVKDCAPWQPLHDKTKTRVSRHTAWYTHSNACNCAYTYGDDTRVEAPADPKFRKVMEDIVKYVFSKFPTLPEEAWPNCANLNLYADGQEGVGWHADDELIFMGTARDCPIMSLSLGGAREFWLALKCEGNPDVKKGVVEVDLRDGDLLTLEGLCQKHCMHTVPRASPSDFSRQQPRINITFRWMRLHKHMCPYAKVAETWYKMAQIQEKSESPFHQDAGEDSLPAHRHDGMRVLDPAIKTVKDASWAGNKKEKGSKYERNVIMSPLPKSARALFGEGPLQQSLQFLAGPPRPNNARQFLRGWSAGTGPMCAIRWQPCDACGHTCWGGGRPCQEGEMEYSGQWFCRCCFTAWAEDSAKQAAQASYQYGGWPMPPMAPMTDFSQMPGFPNGNGFMHNGYH